MKKRNLKQLVEQKVDEAWYNNLDDLYHGVGKAVTQGAIGAATLGGCAYAADRGLENDYQYNQQINQQAAENNKYTEDAYQEWCKKYQLNPDKQSTMNQYNDYVSDNDVNESRLNKIIHHAIKKTISEARSNAYNQRMGNIDSIVRSTMKDLARLVGERMKECASSLYQEGIADAEQIAYQWEREIRNAIFSQNLQNKFLSND